MKNNTLNKAFFFPGSLSGFFSFFVNGQSNNGSNYEALVELFTDAIKPNKNTDSLPVSPYNILNSLSFVASLFRGPAVYLKMQPLNQIRLISNSLSSVNIALKRCVCRMWSG